MQRHSPVRVSAVLDKAHHQVDGHVWHVRPASEGRVRQEFHERAYLAEAVPRERLEGGPVISSANSRRTSGRVRAIGAAYRAASLPYTSADLSAFGDAVLALSA